MTILASFTKDARVGTSIPMAVVSPPPPGGSGSMSASSAGTVRTKLQLSQSKGKGDVTKMSLREAKTVVN